MFCTQVLDFIASKVLKVSTVTGILSGRNTRFLKSTLSTWNSYSLLLLRTMESTCN